jgi:hypothetical protein
MTKKVQEHLQLEFLLAFYPKELHGLAYLSNEMDPVDRNTHKILGVMLL